VAVAAIYGTITYLTNSILPAIVLHTVGNLYSNLDLWLHGKAEWQAPGGSAQLIRNTGTDAPFWISIGVLAVALAATLWTFAKLAAASNRHRGSAA
jgi:hypothetical protein